MDLSTICIRFDLKEIQYDLLSVCISVCIGECVCVCVCVWVYVCVCVLGYTHTIQLWVSKCPSVQWTGTAIQRCYHGSFRQYESDWNRVLDVTVEKEIELWIIDTKIKFATDWL